MPKLPFLSPLRRAEELFGHHTVVPQLCELQFESAAHLEIMLTA